MLPAAARYWAATRDPPGQPAVVVVLCNGTDYRRKGAHLQVKRAKLSACALRSLSTVDLYALTHGFGEAVHAELEAAGFTVLDASGVDIADESRELFAL